MSFVEERSLPFTMTPQIVDLSEELAKDKHILQDKSMERTTCCYKIKEGVPEVTHQQIVEDMGEKSILNQP